MIGIIYHAYNTTTGKAYVGQTRVTLKRRMNQHLYTARNPQFLFQKSIRKHGKDAFVWTTLTACDTQVELDDAETAFICEFQTLVPNGYNLTEGGASGRPSQEVRDRIRATLTGKKHTDERRINVSLGHLGQIAWNKGMKGVQVAWNKGVIGVYKTSAETKEKQRAAKLGKKKSFETINRMRAAASIREAKKRIVKEQRL
jgi:group I intron endonuclease